MGRLDDLYGVYRDAYDALVPLFHRLARVWRPATGMTRNDLGTNQPRTCTYAPYAATLAAR